MDGRPPDRLELHHGRLLRCFHPAGFPQLPGSGRLSQPDIHSRLHKVRSGKPRGRSLARVLNGHHVYGSDPGGLCNHRRALHAATGGPDRTGIQSGRKGPACLSHPADDASPIFFLPRRRLERCSVRPRAVCSAVTRARNLQHWNYFGGAPTFSSHWHHRFCGGSGSRRFRREFPPTGLWCCRRGRSLSS